MSEDVRVDKNLYLDTSETYQDEEGVERYGVYKNGFRDPETHRIRFSDADSVKADAPPEEEAVGREQVAVAKSEDVHPSAVETPSDNNPAQTPDEEPDEGDAA